MWWRRLTWEQFTRAAKFVAAVVWMTYELGQWGARPYALFTILVVLIGSENRHVQRRLGDALEWFNGR